MGSGVVRCPPAAQEPAGGGGEGRPHLGRWRLASREQRGQASGTQLQWGGRQSLLGKGSSRGSLRRLSALRGHGVTAAGPGQDSHVPVITVFLPIPTLSRARVLDEQVLGPWPAVLVEGAGSQEDVGSQGRGLRGRAPQGRYTEIPDPRGHMPPLAEHKRKEIFGDQNTVTEIVLLGSQQQPLVKPGLDSASTVSVLCPAPPASERSPDWRREL